MSKKYITPDISEIDIFSILLNHEDRLIQNEKSIQQLRDT